jgi:mRNA-degrading endonuclease YafQ of YafQ-DinJ toxin-antitoxin module
LQEGCGCQSLFEAQDHSGTGTFTDNPHHHSLRTHKLSGKLRGLWAFVVAYDCRVVFQFLDERNVLLIDIGKHDEVY